MFLPHNVKHQKGFTILELLLSMSFIAILIISIALLTIHLSRLYNQGITMKDINQSGAEIASDIKRSIANASAGAGYPRTTTYDLYSAADPRKVRVICTGSVSYIVNYGQALEEGDRYIRYTSGGRPVRVGKITDNSGRACSEGLGFFGSIPSNRFIPGAYASSARELLTQESGLTLSVWYLGRDTYPNVAEPSLSIFSLVIGTSESEDIEFPSDPSNPADLSCRSASVGGEWCGITVFEIVAQAGK